MIALGLDLSLTGTGWAVVDTNTGRIGVDVVKTSPRDGDILTRIRLIAERVPVLADLAAVEGPSFGSAGNAIHQLSGLWWLVRDKLDRLDVPVAVVAPGQLKQYATGNGNAPKVALGQALGTRLGDRAPLVRDDNACDAVWLALIAAHRLIGAPMVRLPKTHTAALTKVQWPQLPSDDHEVVGVES